MHKLLNSNHNLYTVLKRNNTKFLKPFSQLHIATNVKVGFIVDQLEEDLDSPKPANAKSTVQISHPWPEWVDLMECLMRRGYFNVDGNPFECKTDELGFKEVNCIRTACLNFGRDSATLIRYLSRKDIKVVVGFGCPSVDRKVVNSGKRLRAHVGIDEGNVCSSCNLRGNCERAYVKAREDEGGRTVDVMRILLTYGLDAITEMVENKQCQTKLVKDSVRRLLSEILEYGAKESDTELSVDEDDSLPVQDHLSPKGKGRFEVPMKPGDWRCPKCNFLNFARNVRCLRCDDLYEDKLKQLREQQEHLPLKKGDWICEKCNFMNFAKNTRCLICKEKPPKRQLNPGEWECESCNYVNFRRNMVCLKCDHKRPKTAIAGSIFSQPGTKGGNHSYSNIEANDSRSVKEDGQRWTNQARMWRFTNEDSEDDNQPASSEEDSGFLDFPITGGKSTLSKNPQETEKWKLKIAERDRRAVKAKETDDFVALKSQKRLDFIESTDDEEVSGWFGPNK